MVADPQPQIIGAGAPQEVAGNDARLTNAGTATAHATMMDLFLAAFKKWQAANAAGLALPTPPDAAADAEAMTRSAQTMRALQRRRAQGAYGRSDTMLTGGQGLAGPAPTQRKTLLGL